MAKVKGPLLSIRASGKIADTLVYFPWKGVNAVRSYVVPANPNTADQQTQRGYLEKAVDDWHGIGLDADDHTAWNAHALTRPGPMSGFNSFVKDHLDLQVAGLTPDMGFNGSLTDDADDTFSCSVEEDGSADDVHLAWGTSPTALINLEALAEAPANTWTGGPADNVAGLTLYGRFVIKSFPNEIGYTGIFKLKMAA